MNNLSEKSNVELGSLIEKYSLSNFEKEGSTRIGFESSDNASDGMSPRDFFAFMQDFGSDYNFRAYVRGLFLESLRFRQYFYASLVPISDAIFITIFAKFYPGILTTEQIDNIKKGRGHFKRVLNHTDDIPVVVDDFDSDNMPTMLSSFQNDLLIVAYMYSLHKRFPGVAYYPSAYKLFEERFKNAKINLTITPVEGSEAIIDIRAETSRATAVTPVVGNPAVGSNDSD
jgi:hypothetical protein